MWVSVMNKKTNKIMIFIFILVFICLVVPVVIKVLDDINKVVVKEEISKIDFYGYSLSSTDSDVYKKVYSELDDVLSKEEVDYSSYASLISKLFIIDVFTLDNKLTSTELGGLEFVHNDFKANFAEYLGSSLYNHILSNIDGKRTQKLPIVKDVTVNKVNEIKFTYNNIEYDAYEVDSSIIYEEDMGYQNKIKLTLIRDDRILYIVKGE